MVLFQNIHFGTSQLGSAAPNFFLVSVIPSGLRREESAFRVSDYFCHSERASAREAELLLNQLASEGVEVPGFAALQNSG